MSFQHLDFASRHVLHLTNRQYFEHQGSTVDLNENIGL
jgi:hypothetical protein